MSGTEVGMRNFAVAAVLLTSALLVACGQSPAKQNSKSEPAIGRWVIVHSPQTEKDTVLLDTATGDSWTLLQLGSGDSAPLVWRAIGRGSSGRCPARYNLDHALAVGYTATDIARYLAAGCEPSMPHEPQ